MANSSSDNTDRGTVFLSYAPEDRQAVYDLLVSLRPFERTHGINCWDDSLIKPGLNWDAEIRQALGGTRVAVLFVSRSYMASEYVVRKELLSLLSNERMRGLTVVPVHLEPAGFEEFPDLNQFHFANTRTKPLYALPRTHWDQMWMSLIDVIVSVIASPVQAPEAAAPIRKHLDAGQSANGSETAAGPTSGKSLIRKGLLAGLPEIVWCDVPAGQFVYAEDSTPEMASPYRIAKYPITNVQFEVFVKDPNGYANPKWWSATHKAGFDQQAAGSVEATWPESELPRQMVSWYEAMAFCAWLTDRLNTPIALPTEEQWEKAARGANGLIYPYGNSFDEKRANTRESTLERTSPVDQYPTSASPYGVLDMTGNVWEWTLSEYHTRRNDRPDSDNPRVLRGGSWANSRHYARAAFRIANYPADRFLNAGFRVVSNP